MLLPLIQPNNLQYGSPNQVKLIYTKTDLQLSSNSILIRDHDLIHLWHCKARAATKQ